MKFQQGSCYKFTSRCCTSTTSDWRWSGIFGMGEPSDWECRSRIRRDRNSSSILHHFGHSVWELRIYGRLGPLRRFYWRWSILSRAWLSLTNHFCDSVPTIRNAIGAEGSWNRTCGFYAIQYCTTSRKWKISVRSASAVHDGGAASDEPVREE